MGVLVVGYERIFPCALRENIWFYSGNRMFLLFSNTVVAVLKRNSIMPSRLGHDVIRTTDATYV